MKKTSTPKPNKAVTTTAAKLEAEDKAKRTAELGLSPVVNAAITASRFAKSVGEINPNDAVTVVMDRIGKVKSGDMSGVESTLIAQAMTLDVKTRLVIYPLHK